MFMKSKILKALLMLLPFTQVSAYIDEDDGEVVDQFMLTMGSSGYILCKAVDLAREEGFQYVKILSAEYSLGNQTGGFTCQLEDEADGGQILQFEDEAFKLTVSCMNSTPSDSDYIDTDAYENVYDLFNSTEEETTDPYYQSDDYESY